MCKRILRGLDENNKADYHRYRRGSINGKM